MKSFFIAYAQNTTKKSNLRLKLSSIKLKTKLNYQ
jgi:hypothetical protein